MPQNDNVTVHRRFGLGPKPGDLQLSARDPRGFLRAMIADKSAGRLDRVNLEPSHVVFALAQDAQMTKRLAQLLMQDALKSDPAMGTGAAAMAVRPALAAASPPMQAQPTQPKASLDGTPGRIRREAFIEELAARIDRAVTTDKPFIERLVLFWSNHFCVSSAKAPVRGLAGGFEREAIRPHILGRFADLLRAVEQHPAMLIYLDNQGSTGPNSRAGRNRARGLNENLARETLELHTLGVDGGYTQDDVSNLARLYTGWTVGQTNIERSEPGKFFFAANRHEPGEVTILGKRYPEDGQRSGEKALDDLSRHPATARHVATRLARHFVAERPAAALVAAIEKTFRETDGDLAEVTRTLINAPDAWAQPPVKIVPPYDFAVSLVRGFGLQAKGVEVVRLASLLGQPVWQPPSPKGWPDDDDAWTGPSSIRERLRITEKIVRDIDRAKDPRVLAADLLGPALGEPTRQAIARAETREQGLQMLIMSPEFLRR